ncbi:MAG: SRPBCC family protein [Sandaracinus sp.]|nr:SRPBCC family protein [Sandaracinus sp.]
MHSVFVSFEMNAPAAKVWSIVGDPSQIAVWHPAMAESTMTDRDRRVVLGNGAVVMERIERHDDAGMSYDYVMTDAPLPLEGYKSTLAVKPSANGCVVEWSSTFETEAVDDMVGLVRSVYVDGLSAVREMLST